MPFRKMRSMRSEEEEQDFDLLVKKTFYEYVPKRQQRVHERRSLSAPAKIDEPRFLRKHSGESTSTLDSRDAPSLTAISTGSNLHETGTCKPCAWFWKPTGCMNGAACRHCHFCPFGELTRRKRFNRKLARQVRDQAAESVSDSSSSPLYQSDSSFGTTATSGTPGTHPGPSPHLIPMPRMPGPVEPTEATHPRRLVPRAQTWQNTPPEPRASFVRAHTWQAPPTSHPTHPTLLQSVPEGRVPGASMVLLLPLVVCAEPVQVQPAVPNPTFPSPDSSENS